MKEKRRKEYRETALAPFDRDFLDPFRVGAMALSFPRRQFWPYMGMGFSAPRVDVVDNGDSFTIIADMPGIDKKNIKLSIAKDNVTISAGKASEKEEKGKNYYSRERSSMGYYRSFSLPAEVKGNTAKARYENGTLHIEVKKLKRGSANRVEIE
jgi:HSP20 family protein